MMAPRNVMSFASDLVGPAEMTGAEAGRDLSAVVSHGGMRKREAGVA